MNSLLSAHIHAQGFSEKYLAMSGQLQMPEAFKAGKEDSASAEALTKSKAEIIALARRLDKSHYSEEIQNKTEELIFTSHLL